MEQLLIEAAKQVPALALVCVLVYWFFQDKSRESQKSEDRLAKLVAERDAANKVMQETLAASNAVLGGITVLLTLVEKDLKDAKRPRG